MGARLAAAYSNGGVRRSDPEIDLVERVVANEDDVPRAAGELVNVAGCSMLLGALNVPLSIRSAQWAEQHSLLYVTANNNPLVRDGRRRVFHIGVPSEITTLATARYLAQQRGAKKVCVLHASGEFQAYAASCAVKAFGDLGVSAEGTVIPPEPLDDAALLGRVADSSPDAVFLLDSDLGRVVPLAKAAHAMGRFPPILYARGMVCREFVDQAGPAAEGADFVDIFLRDERAPDEEKALRSGLERAAPGAIATASHGFGWDGLRLLVAAAGAGPDVDAQVAFLERLSGYHGATGDLSFSAANHNGREGNDPTTFARLTGGEFCIVNPGRT